MVPVKQMKLNVRHTDKGWRARLVWPDGFAIMVGDYKTWPVAMRCGWVAYRWSHVTPQTNRY